MTVKLDETARGLIDGRNAATVATLNADGRAQLSVIFVARDEDTLVFSTTTDRLKTRNIKRDPRITVLVMDATNAGKYVEIRGTVELVEDPEKHLPQRMYEKYLGADAPPEPGVDRLIVRLNADRIFCFPPS